MRKLNEQDMAEIKGITIQGYTIESARIKLGQFSDSDHYGIVLGRMNPKGHYVTWQFHLDENGKPVMYWGHYFMEDQEAAIRDFNTRDLSDLQEEEQERLNKNLPKLFEVTITETLKLTVEVEAESQQEAEQIVSDKWHDRHNSEYILSADNFVDVEFNAVQIDQNNL